MNSLIKRQSDRNDILDESFVPTIAGRFGGLVKEMLSPTPLGDFFVDEFNPRVDIYEKDNAFHIDCELAGVDKDAVEVLAEDGVVTIRGEKNYEKEDKKDNYYRMERSWGQFVRRVPLPENCRVEEISAKNQNGVLSIVIPQEASKKARKVEIKSEESSADKQKMDITHKNNSNDK